MSNEKRPPHPATVPVGRAPHAATVQRKEAPFGGPKALPPHAAKSSPGRTSPTVIMRSQIAAPMHTKKISIPNKQWGICGFASSLGALYENDAEARKTIDKALTKGHFRTRLLAEIKYYLNVLLSEESPLLDQIVAFTQSFPGFETFTIADCINRINGAISELPGANHSTDKRDFGIAMPADALVDYLQRIWQLENARVVIGDGSGENDIILGLCDAQGDLKHWVYKKDADHVFNWGKSKNLTGVLAECAGLHIAFYIQTGL